MKYADGGWVLSTGRVVGYAGSGILGLSPVEDGDASPELCMYSGYDNRGRLQRREQE